MISRKKPAPEPLWCDYCRCEVYANILHACTRAATGRCPAREPMKAHVAQWKAARADLERVTETLTDQKDPPVHPLNKIAEQVRFLAAELEAGETIDTTELVMIARRIDA